MQSGCAECLWPQITSGLHNTLINLFAQKNILIEHNEAIVSHTLWGKKTNIGEKK